MSAINSESSMLVVGTGAMGCLFAARFAAAGVPVTMLGSWPAGLRALQQDGVRLLDASGKERSFPVRATSNPAECIGARFAVVLVKSWQTLRAAGQLAGCLATNGLALTLQNGMGNQEILAKTVGAKRVVLGITTAGANLIGPGRVQAAGEGVISLGSHPGLAPLSARLREASFVVENAPDAIALLWGTQVINAAIHPLTALLGVPNGELLNRISARLLLQAVAREAAAVAVAQGIRLPYPDPVVAVENIARRTGENLSSMLQDVQRGAPTEIDAICGAIVRSGEQIEVSTPLNRTLWQLVSALAE